MRRSLDAILLEAGRPEEAEVVYCEDLRRDPENGLVAFGLMKSLEALGKHDQVVEIETPFNAAWARADVTFTSSRF